MLTCETCGNTYDKAFQVVLAGRTHVFDCFECAIQALAPSCGHCGCRVIGHGVEENGVIFCCAHCARHGATHGLRERIEDDTVAGVVGAAGRVPGGSTAVGMAAMTEV
jgi:Rieske Fe-S protein